MNPTLEIFSQGEEIVTGQIIDTNAAWLSQQTIQLGFKITRHSAVGDDLIQLIELLREISQRVDCCICTGGLGPTVDDLTTEAVSKAFNIPLIFDEQAFIHIQKHYERRNRIMPEINRKQAYLPQTAQRIDNDWGTAPAFTLHYEKCWFIFLPGVPSEMKALFTEKILPQLKKRFILQPSKLITFTTHGVGESTLQERINTLILPPQVQLGFRATQSEVQTKLVFPFEYSNETMRLLIGQFIQLFAKELVTIDGLENSYDLWNP